MLKQRIITALVLVALVVSALTLLTMEQFAIVSAAFIGLAAWEWAGLSRLEAIWLKLAYSASVIAMLAVAWILSINEILWVALFFWTMNIYWVLTYPKHAALWQRSRALLLLSGYMAFVPFWLALIILQSELSWLVYIIALIAGGDTCAYFAGKRWGQGRAKLLPAVSPGKTYVGLYASIAWAAGFSLLCGFYLLSSSYHQLVLMVLSIAVVLLSILGDLFESMLKRLRGVKDSGTILPGHGGILDRIDSLLAALPLFVMSVEMATWLV